MEQDNIERITELLKERASFEKDFRNLFTDLSFPSKREVLAQLSYSDLTLDIIDIIENYAEDMYTDIKDLTNLKVRYAKRDVMGSDYRRFLADITLIGLYTSEPLIQISIGRGIHANYKSEVFLSIYLKHINQLKRWTDELNKTGYEYNEISNSLFKNPQRLKDKYISIFKKYVEAEYAFRIFLAETSEGIKALNSYLKTELPEDLSLTGTLYLNEDGDYFRGYDVYERKNRITYTQSTLKKLEELGYVLEVTDISYNYERDRSYLRLYQDSLSLRGADIEPVTELLLPRRLFTSFDEELELIREQTFNKKNPLNLTFE